MDQSDEIQIGSSNDTGSSMVTGEGMDTKTKQKLRIFFVAFRLLFTYLICLVFSAFSIYLFTTTKTGDSDRQFSITLISIILSYAVLGKPRFPKKQ